MKPYVNNHCTYTEFGIKFELIAALLRFGPTKNLRTVHVILRGPMGRNLLEKRVLELDAYVRTNSPFSY